MDHIGESSSADAGESWIRLFCATNRLAVETSSIAHNCHSFNEQRASDRKSDAMFFMLKMNQWSRRSEAGMLEPMPEMTTCDTIHNTPARIKMCLECCDSVRAAIAIARRELALCRNIIDKGKGEQGAKEWVVSFHTDLDALEHELLMVGVTFGIGGGVFPAVELRPLAERFRDRQKSMNAIAMEAAASNRKASTIESAIARLEAVAVAMPAALEASRAGVERVARVIEAVDGLADGPKRKGKPKAKRRERQLQWLAQAMLLVKDHPEWPDTTIAERVDIHKSRLSRSREYQTAARMARQPRVAGGWVAGVDGERSVDAVDDSLDPNRPASRQSQDEEDIDDRIDREISERNAKRNRERNGR